MARTSARSEGREATIGRSTRVRGRISGDGDLTIEGSLEGDVSVNGDVTLAESGRATSDIEALEVTLRGELDGDVHAKGDVRIEAGARVHGDMHGTTVSLEEGAEFVGRLDGAFDLPAELGGASSSSSRRR